MTDDGGRRGDDIGVCVEGAEWPARIDSDPPAELVVAAIAAALADAGPARPVEIGVLLTDDEAVHALNRQYRDRDTPTNVLAFATQDDPTGATSDAWPLPLGDIVIAGGVCRAEAEAQGKRLADHVRHLAVHGTLHLLGFDHEADAEAERMEARERVILAALGVPDPYQSSAAA